MIEALVKDCTKYLSDLEKQRVDVETLVATGKGDEEIRNATQQLAMVITQYKETAKFCKKHAQKPKPKAKSKPGDADRPAE